MMLRKSFLIGLAALTASTAAFAQTPSVGLYFDTEGLTSATTLNGGSDEFHSAYVLAFPEGETVAGAAFMMDILPDITLLDVTYPGGTAVGDPKTGVEITLDAPVAPSSEPVLLSEMTLWTGEHLVYYGRLNTIPHPGYDYVALTGTTGAPLPAVGTCAWLTIPVENESSSWSEVKRLYTD